MFTKEEALAALDPKLPDDEKAVLAAQLVASSVALDAYLDSRPQLEQIIAQASGATQVAPFHANNPSAPVAGGEAAGAIEGSAVAEAEVIPDSEDAELKALEQRVAVLRAKKGA
jgi:hypothetical protein